MLKEVIVVEGKMDVIAVKKAVDADCLITNGFEFGKNILPNIKAAYEQRGIIILTDPDAAGERIRTFLTKKFPKAKQAFVPVENATANGDIGIEQASVAAIRTALRNVQTKCANRRQEFTYADLTRHNLTGTSNAVCRRAKLGAALNIGFANAKIFLRRLNDYGITREKFEQAIETI